MDQKLNDLGIDAITGISLMDQLDMNPDDLAIPQRFSRLKEVIGFFKQFPEDTQRFLITKATRGKAVDKLNHIFEYTKLLTKRSEYEDILQGIDKEKSALGFMIDPIKAQAIAERSVETRTSLEMVSDEIKVYEK